MGHSAKKVAKAVGKFNPVTGIIDTVQGAFNDNKSIFGGKTAGGGLAEGVTGFVKDPFGVNKETGDASAAALKSQQEALANLQAQEAYASQLASKNLSSQGAAFPATQNQFFTLLGQASSYQPNNSKNTWSWFANLSGKKNGWSGIANKAMPGI